jgi:hypothetical protein
MSLLSGLTPPERKYNCKVATILSQIDEKDAEILLNAINSPELWPARTLTIALQARGIILSDPTIGRHRGGSCSCA